jgi:AcrR family transcriptional regulator
MPRPQIHSTESILDAARDLLLESGARALTVDAIAAASGAPVGSIYHRFGSLEGLLAEMWVAAVRRFQASFLAALDGMDCPADAAVGAAVSMYDFAREQPADARLLAALRREDLFEAAGSSPLRDELEQLNRPVEEQLAALSRRLFGNAGPTALQRTTFAVVDIPHGAVRRHLLAGTSPPPALRTWIETAVRSTLKDKTH